MNKFESAIKQQSPRSLASTPSLLSPPPALSADYCCCCRPFRSRTLAVSPSRPGPFAPFKDLSEPTKSTYITTFRPAPSPNYRSLTYRNHPARKKGTSAVLLQDAKHNPICTYASLEPTGVVFVLFTIFLLLVFYSLQEGTLFLLSSTEDPTGSQGLDRARKSLYRGDTQVLSRVSKARSLRVSLRK